VDPEDNELTHGDEDQERQRERNNNSLPPVAQDNPPEMDYRNPIPPIQSESEEDSDDEDPLLLKPRAPIRRRSPRLNMMQEMALASVQAAEAQEDPQSYRAAMQSSRSD
jgi:hypothetical protein